MSVKIVVRKRGGLFDIAREIAVDDGTFSVSEDGAEVTRGQLAPDMVAHLRSLVQGVIGIEPVLEHAGGGVDAGVTTVELETEGKGLSFEIRAGDESPDLVWDLLDEVDQIEGGLEPGVEGA